ncbi:hypothetical protein NDU88_006418 [Pleurodeles waltl]|uniref:Uncharacterized protein n=1 Tax=Pleurodeles waltl TaxID=8319 RepID=A0AAV7NQ74_PLEWA|nr:hypothetical protein NDU88_006417 [Pleurodeles waltl]KAJ1118223.1 hypothetical protein NDU88_006418 [Pleurodeles waltl]
MRRPERSHSAHRVAVEPQTDQFVLHSVAAATWGTGLTSPWPLGPARLSRPPRQAELRLLLLTAVSGANPRGQPHPSSRPAPRRAPPAPSPLGLADSPSCLGKQRSARCSPSRSAQQMAQPQPLTQDCFSTSERVPGGSCHFEGWPSSPGISLLGASPSGLDWSFGAPDYLSAQGALGTEKRG